MNEAIEILIQKLSSDGKSAEHAANALILQARRHKSKLESVIKDISSHLHHRKLSVRAAVSEVFAYIGTTKAIEAMLAAILSTPDQELTKQCAYDSWSEKPLYQWFVSHITETEHTAVPKVLVSLLKSPDLSKPVKSFAMKELSAYDPDEHEIVLPENIIAVLADFASSKDPAVSEGAILLLGRVQGNESSWPGNARSPRLWFDLS